MTTNKTQGFLSAECELRWHKERKRKNEIQNSIDAQLDLISKYLNIADKNIEADTLMAQDYQHMAKEAAETLEILQRICHANK